MRRIRLGRFSLVLLVLLFVFFPVLLKAQKMPDLARQKEIKIDRGYSKEALKCIECHMKETPGIVTQWRSSRMAHANVSCYDCHVVKKSHPSAIQCPGLKGTNIYISALVSPKTCARCHPKEVEQFQNSAHARLASRPVVELPKFKKLMFYYEGGQFAGMPKDDPRVTAPRDTGCQACHGGKIVLGPDKKPISGWPGGIGTRYPDGGIGNCVACHYRHTFSLEQARKPETCGRCHMGPDHPNIEVYLESKHGQLYSAHGEKWKWDSAPELWEPGDYEAPTCAVCHMSGIGDLATTHNVSERLYWALMWADGDLIRGVNTPKDQPERGYGPRGRKLMKKVCANCHSSTHTEIFFNRFDNAVKLYDFYHDKAYAMLQDLKKRGLLKDDPWSDSIQELYYYFWHHLGRRVRQAAAMDGPDYAHWHGFFQLFQVYKDIEAIYKWRIKHGKIEELSPVMSPSPE